MPIVAPKGQSAPPVPAGTHQAVCYGICAVGTQPSDQFGPKSQVVVIWELPHERADFGDKKNQPRAISKRYTLSLGKKANLRRDLENWRGKPFTEDEATSFEIDRLIAANCLLAVQHKETTAGTYANVTAVSPLAKGMTKFPNENQRLYFNLAEALDRALFDGKPVEFPANMPEWLVTLAKSSEEYKAFVGGKSNPPPAEEAHPDPEKAGPDDEESVPF